MTSPLHRTIFIGFAAFLAGCSSVPNPFGGGQAAEEKAANKSERISMVTADETLEPDASFEGVAVILPEAVTKTEWPQTGGSASKYTGHVAGNSEFSRLWTAKVGKGSSRKQRIVAAPVVADGKICAMGASQSVRCFNAETGARLWAYEIEAPHRRDKVALGGGIAILENKLIVTSGFGLVLALDMESGAEIWRRRSDSPVTGAPSVHDGRVFVTNLNNELMVLNAETGEAIWVDQAIEESARMLATPSSAVNDDILVTPYSSGEIVAYYPPNGQRLWTDALTRSGRFTPISMINDIAGRPVISGGAIYVNSHSGLIGALDARSGQRIWVKPFASTQTPAVIGEFVFGVSVNGQLAAFDRRSGSVVWASELPKFSNKRRQRGRITWFGPLVYADRLILVSSKGKLIDVDTQTGQIQREINVKDPVFVEPIAANGKIYVLTDDGRLIAFG